ncbi:MAG: hypothetical protein AAF561_02350 [Planctomycetota bacterium]
MKPHPTVVTLAVTLVSTPAWAGTILLDQSYDAFADGATGGGSIIASQSNAQTFTVGLGGTLAQLGVQVQQSSLPPIDDLVITFLGVDSGGIPDIAQNLGNISVPPSQVPPLDFSNVVFSVFDVSGLGITVSPGDVLTFELSYAGTDDGGYFQFDQDNAGA